MEDCVANTNTPDLIDASGAVLKTSKEKGSALLQRFVQQSNQNNLDERKAVWKGLDRNLTEAGSNDNLITELGFTEALSGLSNNTAPGPDKVKYYNNNNNRIQRRHSRFFTVSSQRRELSPTRTLKWPRRNRVQITCNTSSAYHVQHVVLRATWYEGTAQLLNLTVLKSHLFEL